MSYRKRRILGAFVVTALVSATLAVFFWVLPSHRIDFHGGWNALLDGTSARLRRRQDALLHAITSDPARYKAFYRKYQMYHHKMDEEQRENLRETRKRLESDSQAVSLNRELAKYTTWLSTVPYYKPRIDAADTIGERLEIIREIKDRQDSFSAAQKNSDSAASFTFPDSFDASFRDTSSADDPETQRQPTSSELAAYLENADSQLRARFLSLTPQELLYELETLWRNDRRR